MSSLSELPVRNLQWL